MARTKIICTIGPASESVESLRDMIRAGMKLARLNFSHGTHEAHRLRMENLRRAGELEGAVIPIIGDLQGPKFRIGAIAGGSMKLDPGDEIVLSAESASGGPRQVHLPHPELFPEIRAGQRLLIDDGQIELRAAEASKAAIRCEVVNGGVLSSQKGVSIPEARLDLPSLTEKDRLDVEFAVREKLDFLALSFARSRQDILQLRDLLKRLGSSLPIIAKIEKPEALENFDEILAESNAIMVARGDLGVEIPAERVPFVQKDLIGRSNAAGIPVITATQMLNSMIGNPRPTRAEASDIANAILDGTSAAMLSGETASGKYPVEAVRVLESISTYAEDNIPYEQWIYLARKSKSPDAPAAISQATIEIAHELEAKAIVTSTYSGLTARWVASYRHRTPVVAITPNPDTFRQLALLWGVVPRLVPRYNTTDQMLQVATQAALETGAARSGDTILITAGIPPGAGQHVNMVKVHTIP